MRLTMTILVKTSTVGKKPTNVTVLPLVASRQVKRDPYRLKSSTGAFLCLALVTLSVVILGFTSGVMLFREYVRSSNVRYRGFCTVSSTKDMDYLVMNDTPNVPWFAVPAVQMKVFSSPSDLINPNILNQLLEEMAIEDRLETITVRDGQRVFEIVHDFDDNLTSIRSEERCFVMDLIHDFVLEPSTLIASFHNESRLELSHAHSTFRAQLPALAAPPRACRPPAYRLDLQDTLVLRKRSVEVGSSPPPATSPAPEAAAEASSHDFVQFSGNHLQRITISNMADVLQYEEARSGHTPHPKLAAARPQQ
ncbi:uncharacterized protein [Epargyreus clarus]|uniref:uncharacterized protein isoform X2 n=1 Tax=Epargyreus clarus TaxID=520877 RepID=UPI003C2E4522